MAGIWLPQAFPVYPHGFPAEIIAAFEKQIGRQTLGNKPASGTEIIKELGEEHVRTGKPIVYTSGDSVFQIATHEDIIPIAEFKTHASELLRRLHAQRRPLVITQNGKAAAVVLTPGEFEDLENAKARLELIVPISLLIILALLYGLFNSLRDSLMALAGIPFAAGGGIIALYLSGLNFSISAAVGLVSLFGVSVMNGILIMTYYNELRAGSTDTTEAMFRAASQRMRPLLMTAFSACIGLLPAAVSTGIGSQVQRPLATVVVGGMFIGPIILLVVVPALQTLFLDRTREAPPAAEPEPPPARA